MASTLTRLLRRKMITGERAIINSAPRVETGSVKVQAGSTSVKKGSGKATAASTVIDNPILSIENEHPDQTHIRQHKHMGKWKLRLSRAKNFWKPQPTALELAELEQRRNQERIRLNMVREMRAANRALVNCLTNLGFNYIRASKNKNELHRVQMVHFSKWVYSNDGNTIFGKIDRTPYGVSKFDMINERVLTELSAAVGHPVDGKLDENGLIYWVSLAGRNDFVDKVLWREMLPLVPKTALPLTFIVGSTRNGGREWRHLESMPHMLGAGETGGGKTNFMHNMICTFISRNTPADVRLLMIDLKFGGVSLNKYKGIPHLLPIPEQNGLPEVPSGVANDIPSATAVLQWALEESQKRGELFLTDTKHNPEKIETWNKYHRNKHLPRIVIFIDELALLMDKSDVDSKEEMTAIKLARTSLKGLLRLARSSGIHVCGFTQSLDKSVMGVAFKTNVSGRVCFAVADVPSSVLVVNDASAVNLRPAGRAIFKRGTDTFMAQTPLIEEPDITEAIQNARENRLRTDLVRRQVTPEEIIIYSIERLNYSLNRDLIAEQFKGQVSFNKLDRVILPGMEGQIYEINGEKFTVVPGVGNLHRHVERVPDSDYTPTTANKPATPVTPKAKISTKFAGLCPECGAPRHKTPCEWCRAI